MFWSNRNINFQCVFLKPGWEVFVCVTSLWPWWLMVYCFIRQSRDNYDLLSRNCAPLRKVEKGRFVDNYALWRINWASLRFAVLLIYIFFVLSTFSWQPNKNNAKIKFLYSCIARFQDLEEMLIVPYLHQSSQWPPSPPQTPHPTTQYHTRPAPAAPCTTPGTQCTTHFVFTLCQRIEHITV